MNFIDGVLFKQCIQAAYKKLDQEKKRVDELNVFPVPDGDTGTNMSLTMKSAVDAVEEADDQLGNIGKALGNGSLMGARGNSGVILSQLCRGVAKSLKNKNAIYVYDIAEITQASTDKAYKAVMKPTEGTILTVARSISDFAQAKQDQYEDIGGFLIDILKQAQNTLQQTPSMLPPLKEAGVVDAGGQGLVYLLAGFVAKLTGEDLAPILEAEGEDPSLELTHMDVVAGKQAKEDFIAKLLVTDIDRDALTKDLDKTGAILSVSKQDLGYLVQIATDRPDKVVKHLVRQGKLLHFNLVNRDFNPKAFEKKEEGEKSQVRKRENLKPYGFVAVASGDGFKEIFKNLMVDELIEGGQTMNPSTKDIYEAVEKVGAETTFILPNNKNIIMAADQVHDLCDGQEVYVIPSRSIPQGIQAILHFDEASTVEENLKAMTDSLSGIKTGEVTYAIRDSEVNGLDIKKNQYIGLLDGEITDRGDKREDLVLSMLDKMVEEESSFISLYPGQDVDQAEYEKLARELEKKFPDLELVCEPGGQPVYSYIFSVE